MTDGAGHELDHVDGLCFVSFRFLVPFLSPFTFFSHRSMIHSPGHSRGQTALFALFSFVLAAGKGHSLDGFITRGKTFPWVGRCMANAPGL
jgi:hypothetical protein